MKFKKINTNSILVNCNNENHMKTINTCVGITLLRHMIDAIILNESFSISFDDNYTLIVYEKESFFHDDANDCIVLSLNRTHVAKCLLHDFNANLLECTVPDYAKQKHVLSFPELQKYCSKFKNQTDAFGNLCNLLEEIIENTSIYHTPGEINLYTNYVKNIWNGKL